MQIDSLTVGETFNYSLRLDKDRTYDEIIFPDSSAFGEDVEIQSRQQFKLNEFRDSLSFTLQFFGTEDSRIPRLPIHLVSGTDTTTVHTNPVALRFRSVLASEEEEFRPLKPIFDFAAAWWPWLLALLLLGLAGYYIYRYVQQQRNREEPEPEEPFRAVPFRDPLAELDAAIRQLEKVTFSGPGDFKQFYITLGDAIRTYFEDLYTIPAMELTSREILMELKRRSVDEELVTQTRIVLNEADLVKFARFEPTEEQTEVALEKARAFYRRARQIDGPRVEQLRRKHLSEMEAERKAYEQRQKLREEEQV